MPDFQGADEQKIIAAALERHTYLNMNRRGRLWYWQECQYAWERKFGESWGEIMDSRSHRYIPSIFQAIETGTAQFMQALMPNDRCFKTLGRNKTSQSNAGMMEAKLRWDHYRMNFRKTFGQWMRSACIMGNVPWTVQWHTEHSTIPDEELMMAKQEMVQAGLEVEINDPSGLGYATSQKITFEGGRLIVGDIFNYVQERHPDDDRFAFRAYRSAKKADWLKAKWAGLVDPNGQPVYKHLEDLHDDRVEYNELGDSLKRAIDQSMGYSPLPRDGVELITFCGDLIVPEVGLYHNCFGVIANRQHLLRFVANPFAHGLPPWQLFTLIPDPHDPFGYGTGLAEPILGIQDFVNVRINQSVDANSLAITPPLSIVVDGITDTHNIVWGPGENLWQRQQGNIMPMAVSKDALSLSLQEIQYFKAEIASTTGTFGGTSATPEGASATESAGIQKSAGAVQAEQIKHIEQDGLIPILRMQASLNQQLMPPGDPVMVRLFVDEQGQITDPATGAIIPMGMHWAELTASDIQGEFDYEVVGASTIAQQANQQQMQMQFIQTVSQDPEFSMMFDKRKFFRRAMEKLGFTDAWEYIKSEEQVQYEQQQLALQQQMGQQGSASGPPQGGGEPGRGGVSSLPGSPGGGGSAARPPYPQQLAGPSRMG